MLYPISNTCTVLGKVIQKPTLSFSFLCYYLKGEKNILIDTVPERCAEKLIEELKSFDAIQNLDALILNHSEDDHSGGLGALLSEIPNLPIYCTEACKLRLIHQYPQANFICLPHSSQLTIGDFDFSFYHTPGLHWDDNMVTYYHNERILFSNDLFGQSYGAEPPLDEEASADAVFQGLNIYFDKVFKPATPEEKAIITSLIKLDIDCVAPGHGVVLQTTLESAFNFYKECCAV